MSKRGWIYRVCPTPEERGALARLLDALSLDASRALLDVGGPAWAQALDDRRRAGRQEHRPRKTD